VVKRCSGEDTLGETPREISSSARVIIKQEPPFDSERGLFAFCLGSDRIWEVVAVDEFRFTGVIALITHPPGNQFPGS
jgi:hypothetical protein